MSFFERDLKKEEVLGKYLDHIYKQKDIPFERISDLEQQHRGIDLIYHSKNKPYYIDEKAQLDYLNYIKVNESAGWHFHQFGFIVSETEDLQVSIEGKKEILATTMLEPQGVIIPRSSRVDLTRPQFYHPRKLEDEPALLKHLENQIHRKEAQSFVVEVGLTHLFHTMLPSVHYGVITESHHNYLKLFSLKESTFSNKYVHNRSVSDFKPFKIVVFNNNLDIRVLSKEEESLERIGYIESDVIGVSLDQEEGFIFKPDSQDYGQSDYFFHFKHCDFTPKVGDRVRFLPILNYSTKHKNEPVAIKISMVGRNRCRILNSYLSSCGKHLKGTAIDLSTSEKLFFSTNDLTQNFEADDVYTCYTKKEKVEGQYLRWVKLIEKVSEVSVEDQG